MILNVIIDDQTRAIDVAPDLMAEVDGFLDKMDRDMDAGWQMGRDWLEDPDALQRCQIVADRLLTAVENDNEPMALMMAAYILRRVPGVTAVNIDTAGEPASTQIITG
jgi:hypothetical protein